MLFRSKENFHIEDGKIYFGFSNIKGIGKEVGKSIVDGQPYDSLSDFLNRFGTDASVLKPLVALGVFDEQYDRLTLRKFSEFYKDKITKRKQRQQRYEASLAKKIDDLREKLLEQVHDTDPDLPGMCQFTPEAEALWEKRFSTTMIDVPYKYRGEERIRQI